MNITINIRSVYGSELAYVVDPDQQRAIQRLTGRKTLNGSDIAALEQLGHTISEGDADDRA